MRSSRKFCRVLIMQGRKLRRMKMRIRDTRKGSSQENRGDWVRSWAGEGFVFQSWISLLRRDRVLMFCSTSPDSLT
jgi:hypothetical protein